VDENQGRPVSDLDESDPRPARRDVARGGLPWISPWASDPSKQRQRLRQGAKAGSSSGEDPDPLTFLVTPMI
jgi:hypothetical protein